MLPPGVKVLNVGGLVTKSCPALAIPWTVAHQAPLSMGFSRQEYWSGLPFPSPGDLPQKGIKPMSPALAGRFFTSEPHGKPAKKSTFDQTAVRKDAKENSSSKLCIPRQTLTIVNFVYICVFLYKIYLHIYISYSQ